MQKDAAKNHNGVDLGRDIKKASAGVHLVVTEHLFHLELVLEEKRESAVLGDSWIGGLTV